jgi:hypothetical protein
MKKILKILSVLLILAGLLTGCSEPSIDDASNLDMGNIDSKSQLGDSVRITYTRNSSDPAARWFYHDDEQEGEMYVYTTSDLVNGGTYEDYPINTIYCYTAPKGSLSFTDRGAMVSESDFSWAQQINHMWAPDCELVNGEYVLYVPMLDQNGVSRLGIAVSDEPADNFTALSNPLYIGGNPPNNGFAIDPNIFYSRGYYFLLYTNDYWPDGRICIARLYSKTYARFISEIRIDNLPYDMQDKYMEGAHLQRVYVGSGQFKFYLVFSVKSDDTEQEVIAYATSSRIISGYTYEGIIMDSFDEEWTNQSSICQDSDGDWFFFYQYGNNNYPTSHYRQACVIPFEMDNGEIPELFHD